MVNKNNNFDLSDVDKLLGTKLSTSVSGVQNSLNDLQPKIQFVNDHWLALLLLFYLTITICVVIGTKLSAKI